MAIKVEKQEEQLKRNPTLVKKLESQLEENISFLKLVKEIINTAD
ncbi:MAG: hypothetical protein ACFE9L_11990 [Candidatus Hodarchaeota archaeon]